MSLSQLAIINGGFIRGNRVYEQGYSFTLGDVEREFPFPKKPFFIETLGMPAASLPLALMMVITYLPPFVVNQARTSGRLSRRASAQWKNGLGSSCTFRRVRHWPLL